MSYQTRVMQTETTITDSAIVIKSRFQNQEITDVIGLPDGTEDTDYATKMNAHKNACKGAPPANTSPSVSVSTNGQWVVNGNTGTTSTVSSRLAVINVPVGNPGNITFHITESDGTSAKYVKNGGTPTVFTDGAALAVAQGDTIQIQGVALPAGGVLLGSITDTNTGVTIDVFKITN
jgi:hypothetical protein